MRSRSHSRRRHTSYTLKVPAPSPMLRSSSTDRAGATSPALERRRVASTSTLQEMAVAETAPPSTAQAHSYRLVMLGAAQVGKTAIVNQFLYDHFLSEYEETVEEMYRAEYEVGAAACCVSLDILDTSGVHAFPAMRKLSIAHADGFVLVYSIDSARSFEEVKRIRDQILEERDEAMSLPIVVVGNKSDEEGERVVERPLAEMTVCVEWGHGFVECSAKSGDNVGAIFKELLVQRKLAEPSSPVVRKSCDLSPTQLKQMKYSAMSGRMETDLRRIKYKKRKQDSCIMS